MARHNPQIICLEDRLQPSPLFSLPAGFVGPIDETAAPASPPLIAPPPQAIVTGFVVNSGDVQRSRITRIDVSFAGPVDLADFTAPGAVFLTRTGIPSVGYEVVGTVVNSTNGLVLPQSGFSTTLALTFQNIDNAGIDWGSLADGRWQLSIVPAGYSSPNGPLSTDLRRLFGNFNNDSTVDGNDFGFFPSFGTAVNHPYDFNNDGAILADDLGEFGNRFGVTLL